MFLKHFPEGLLGKQLSNSIDREKHWYYFAIPPNVSLDWIDSPYTIIGFYEMLSGKNKTKHKTEQINAGVAKKPLLISTLATQKN